MNYYNEIKKELINNEVTKKVKTYSINKSDLDTYYNVGKLLSEAGNKYGEGIIKEYSKRLTKDINSKYSARYLFDIRKLYYFLKVHSLNAQLTFAHYRLLFSLKNNNEISYYIEQSLKRRLSVRQLRERIKSKEYERLPEETKNKLITNNELDVSDLIKDPIVIKKSNNYDEISEKVLQKSIMEDIPSFLKELGEGFTFIDNEYKIKIGNYYNYIDKNIKTINQDKTIGLIVCRENNQYIIEYSTDKRIIAREYMLE